MQIDEPGEDSLEDRIARLPASLRAEYERRLRVAMEIMDDACRVADLRARNVLRLRVVTKITGAHFALWCVSLFGVAAIDLFGDGVSWWAAAGVMLAMLVALRLHGAAQDFNPNYAENVAIELRWKALGLSNPPHASPTDEWIKRLRWRGVTSRRDTLPERVTAEVLKSVEALR